MAEIELVIKIDEEDYLRLKEKGMFGKVDVFKRAVKNGTPLPKGHGRLCDMDEALKCIEETADCKIKQYAIGMLDWAMSKRTIIEADKVGDTDE